MTQPAYDYDPAKIQEGGKDQMRFELGDTAIEGGRDTCALSDEEYAAIIEANAGRGFQYAKYKCLEAIMMRMAFETDYSADGMSLSMSQRYDRWKEMWLRMQKQYQTITASPAALGKNKLDGGHYFRLGMNDNPRTIRPYSPFRKF